MSSWTSFDGMVWKGEARWWLMAAKKDLTDRLARRVIKIDFFFLFCILLPCFVFVF